MLLVYVLLNFVLNLQTSSADTHWLCMCTVGPAQSSDVAQLEEPEVPKRAARGERTQGAVRAGAGRRDGRVGGGTARPREPERHHRAGRPRDKCHFWDCLVLKLLSISHDCPQNGNDSWAISQGSDVGNSNPFYHWGALSGYIGMREKLAEAEGV
eukprot:SAG11_NODE_3943_length_2138_cov_3.445807_2_plen_155_part_00